MEKLARKKKIKITTLNAGIFSITSSTGEIAPNEGALIEIKSNPQEAKQYEENIVVFISESSDEDMKGKIVKISLMACEPKVNFDNLDFIFKEQYIVDRLENYQMNNVMQFQIKTWVLTIKLFRISPIPYLLNRRNI